MHAPDSSAPHLAIVGAGPVGLALALHAALVLPRHRVTLFDARSADRDVSADPRTLALSLGSVQWLQRLGAWPAESAEPITTVHVSQAPPSWEGAGTVRLTAADAGVPMLGAVIAYGPLVAALQRAWEAAVERGGPRLGSRFGTPVTEIRTQGAGVEIDAGVAETFDLAVVAEGGVFADQARKALTHDYRQTAWVGTAELAGAQTGTAIERFTRHGPVALLPLKPTATSGEAASITGSAATTAASSPASPPARAALVWCTPSHEDPVVTLDSAQRIAVLNTLLPPEAGRVTGLSPLKSFPLGLNAERTLVDGRQVRIGNAAQTLHPVAGQGLNLGLRDACALVEALRFEPDIDAALRRVEWQRAPDRWSMIATTDFLARSFTWRWPGVAALRGLALGALQQAGPIKRALARQMMFGQR